MTEIPNTKMRRRKVTVRWGEGEDDYEIVYVMSRTKAKGERLAILATADYWDKKTSDLTATSEVIKDDEPRLNPAEYDSLLAIKNEDMEE